MFVGVKDKSVGGGDSGKRVLPLVAFLIVLGGCESPTYLRTNGLKSDGGPPQADGPRGGDMRTGGVGGQVEGSGGYVGSGGADAGGATATGGGPAAGGAVATGGRDSTGGRPGSGGVTASGGAAVPGGTGGRSGTGGSASGGAGTGGAPTGPGKYDFESLPQSWSAAPGTPAFETLALSTSEKFAGASSLAATISATGGALYRLVVTPVPGVPVGATVTFHIRFPAQSAIDWIQPYALGVEPQSSWTGSAVPTPGLMAAAWNKMTITVPPTSEPVRAIGVEFHITGAWSGIVYIDEVSW